MMGGSCAIDKEISNKMTQIITQMRSGDQLDGGDATADHGLEITLYITNVCFLM